MSKVVYWMTVSLDGFVETTDGKIDWTATGVVAPRNVNVYPDGRRTAR